jgi:hypothetical protein
MTGKPLQYRADDGTVMVYSVGRNLRDDGGQFAPENEADDLAWTHAAARR